MSSEEIKAKYKDRLSEENALLLRILDGTSHETGDAFFRSLVKELALVLNTYGALVANYGHALTGWLVTGSNPVPMILPAHPVRM